MPARRLIVITGASSGIGAEFARQYAALGADLVVVARRSDRLDALAAELLAAHGTRVTVLVEDLSSSHAARSIFDALAERALTADGLVNCAGFGTAGPFLEEDPARLAEELAVNVAALTALTRLLLPQLIASRAGVLINVSSTAAYQPLPGLAVYAATKAYVTSLTEAIWGETRGTRLKVLALAPGPTETEFFDVAGSDDFRVGQTATAQRVVGEALAVLRRRNPPPSHIVGGLDRLQAVSAGLVPRRLVLAIAVRLTGQAR
jgi:short-subunit dehydrogenase